MPYRLIASSETDPEAPITSSLMKALDGNSQAIAEQDAGVPLNSRIGFWLLGTIATTSGTSQSLTGLDLNTFNFLVFEVIGVSFSAASSTLRIGGQDAAGNISSTDFFYGSVWVSLFNGHLFRGALLETTLRNTGYSKATTTVTVAASSGNFDAGSVRVYGVK